MPCKKCKDDKYKWGNTGECKYATKDECEKANPKKYSKMRPTPLGKKSYEEYAKELKEFNLSKVQRVELGIADDVKKISNEIYSVDEKLLIKNVLAPVRKAIVEFEKVGKLEKKIEAAIKEAKTALKDLGINPKKAPWLEDGEIALRTAKTLKKSAANLSKIEKML